MSEVDDDETGYGSAPEPKRIRWEMVYSKDGRKEMIFEKELALAALLMAEQVFVNNHWWREDWPEVARKTCSLNVNCNDVFAWGCADAEEMSHGDIEAVYDSWQKDPIWGTSIWCMIKRRQMPQRPVQKDIERGGRWNFEELRREHDLRANYYDGVSGALARMKYSTYSTWASSLGNSVLPFDAGWWVGWKEYTATIPDWRSPEWEASEQTVIAAWKIENGWATDDPE